MDENTNVYTPEDIQNAKSLAWLSYLGFLFLIPMLVNKDSAYTKFHVNQGIVLFITEIIYGVLAGILSGLSLALLFVPGIGGVLTILFNLVILAAGVVLTVFAILGIVNSVQGKAKELPIIGKIRILK